MQTQLFFLLQRAQDPRQVFGLAAVLTRKIQHGRNSLLNPFQTLWVQFDRIKLPAQQGNGFVDIDARVVEHGVDFGKSGFEFGKRFQALQTLREDFAHGAVLIVVEHLCGMPNTVDEIIGMRQAGVFLIQLAKLTVPGCQCFHLVDLVLEQVNARAAVTGFLTQCL